MSPQQKIHAALNRTRKQNDSLKCKQMFFSLSLQPADNKEAGSESFDEITEPFIILLSDCDCSVDSRRPFPLLLIRSSLWSEVAFCSAGGGRLLPASTAPHKEQSNKKKEVCDVWGQRDAPRIRQKTRLSWTLDLRSRHRGSLLFSEVYPLLSVKEDSSSSSSPDRLFLARSLNSPFGRKMLS